MNLTTSEFERNVAKSREKRHTIEIDSGPGGSRHRGVGDRGVWWKSGGPKGRSGDRTKLPLSVNGLAGQILRA